MHDILFYIHVYRSHRSAKIILPSYLKRKRPGDTGGSKRPKTIQVWDRDIICLPKRDDSTTFPFPRGKFRNLLGVNGLIGKIRLTSDMGEEEVENEIRSVFRWPMDGRDDFMFSFLQSTGVGTRTLTIPSVSASFQWTAQQVAKLGSYKQAIYIIAIDELQCSLTSKVSIII